MGVHGLWKLLDPSGKPVPLETLENKILAVDVSIWLHQVVKGFQDSQGNSLPNAHLLGLFHRVCKLLFYKIKPVFVFDGGVPHLKKQTVITRRQQKSKAELEADKLREQLLKNLVKHAAVKRILGNSSKALDLSAVQQQGDSDMFKLPPDNKKLEESLSGSDDDTVSSDDESHSHKHWSNVDLHGIDVNSTHFKSLPADVRHDILSELKETRKQSSWGRLHEMPKESSDFSSYQMSRLLKRRSVQVSLEDAEREMGGHSLSLGELEEMLNEQGVVKYPDDGSRIASDSTTRYLYIKEIGNQIMQIKSDRSSADESSSSQVKEENKPVEEIKEAEKDIKDKDDDFLKDVLNFIPEEVADEDEEEEADADLSSNSEHETHVKTKLKNNEDINLKLAQNFMFENSGLTQQQILAVIQYQNALESDTQQNSENFFSPDQPSTSGINSPSTSGISNINKQMKEKDIENSVAPTAQETISKSVSNSRSSILHDISPLVDDCHEIKTVSAGNKDVNDKSDTSKFELSNAKEISNLNNLKSIEKISELQVPSNIEKEGNAFGEIIDESESELLHLESKKNDDVRLKEVQEINSDTDDDGFVEVDNENSSPLKNDTKNSLEVIIQREKMDVLEDDIFADIFVEKISKVSIPSVKSVTNGDVVEDKEIAANHEEAGKIQGTNYLEDSKSAKEENECNEEEKYISRADHRKEESTSENKVESAFDDVSIAPKISNEELQQLQVSLQEERRDLMAEQGRQERLAANITDQMCMEAQELLQLFGVPYIVAPMEAEAQCAFLDLISFTDGTITDDSDIWLFGGQKVYKNFFNQKKHVLRFQASDIKHYFKLERQQMVMLALLVGSDYTPGIQGVGPVTALEILAAFPPSSENVLSGLQKFRDWLSGGMKVGPGKTPLKNKLKNVQFTEGFPNQAVVDAYLNPKVDESKETFSWGYPDLESLRDFTKQKFGWTRIKSDEILLPVMKKQEERRSQRSLDSYFKVIPKLHAADGKLSKRVQQAVQRIGRETASESEDETTENSGTIQPKRKRIDPNDTKPKSSTPRVRGRGRGRGRGKCVIPSINQECIVPSGSSSSTEFIPQRERDKINALKSKLRAIEVFRTSRIDKGVKKSKKTKRRILKEAKLSESSSDSE